MNIRRKSLLISLILFLCFFLIIIGLAEDASSWPPLDEKDPQISSFIDLNDNSAPEGGETVKNQFITLEPKTAEPEVLQDDAQQQQQQKQQDDDDAYIADINANLGLGGGPGPHRKREEDEIVPYLMPMKPFPPRFFELNNLEPTMINIQGDFNGAPLGASLMGENPFHYGFYGPQSEDVEIEDCSHLDAFLVSPLPSSVASRFEDFIEKEKRQQDGMPYLHHIHMGHPLGAPLGDAEGEKNPRVIVEGGKTTPLWSDSAEGKQKLYRSSSSS